MNAAGSAVRIFLLIGMFLMASTINAASQMSCGSALVKLGDGKTEVLAKCGEPDYREVVSGSNDSKREIWVYRFGTSRLVHTLTFTGFRLDDIVVESYR
ncbi:MAG: DUF2845 domain-containing protein [Gammaproteobacteria bacterium]|nr:DUF2845 domain-containing protein [Gammaproteobacteria bacterium]